MIVGHLIGGNEVEGFTDGIVIVNGEQLKTSYKELAYVCGSISLGDLDTSITVLRDFEDVQNDYIKLVKDFDSELGEDFVIENHLAKEVCYSSYRIFENQTLVLDIDIYE